MNKKTYSTANYFINYINNFGEHDWRILTIQILEELGITEPSEQQIVALEAKLIIEIKNITRKTTH